MPGKWKKILFEYTKKNCVWKTSWKKTLSNNFDLKVDLGQNKLFYSFLFKKLYFILYIYSKNVKGNGNMIYIQKKRNFKIWNYEYLQNILGMKLMLCLMRQIFVFL